MASRPNYYSPPQLQTKLGPRIQTSDELQPRAVPNGYIPHGNQNHTLMSQQRMPSPNNIRQPFKPGPGNYSQNMSSFNPPASVSNARTSHIDPLTHNQSNDQHLRGSPGLQTPERLRTLGASTAQNGSPQMNTNMTPLRQNTTSPLRPPVQPTSQPPAAQPPLIDSTPLGAPTRKRRPYPQQVAPSIPTSYNQQNTPSTSFGSHPEMPSVNNTMQPQMQSGQNIRQHQMPNNAYPSRPNQSSNMQKANLLMSRLTVEQSPTCPVNLLEQRQIVPQQPLVPPQPPMSQESLKKNAKPEILRCTFNAVPQTSSLLKQCKLPFGIYIHPFKEDMNIPIVPSVITRCRSCRSYLNPYVSILDHRRWQCNMCFRINDLPEELSYDYSTKQYTDVRRRPELSCASIEFIAPSEYMLRPPQPSVFIFVLDVSFNAISTGYLSHACEVIAQNIDRLPGDSRTMMGFITFNSSVHFYSLKSSQNQPQMYIMSDLEDVYIPVPDGLLVNLKENKDTILQLLESLPSSSNGSVDTHSATGAALLAAKKMLSSTGGRVTLFQTCLPSVGPGKLIHRESSAMSATNKDVQCLNPSTDFYKKLALECAGEQIAVDLFLLAGQYCDLASLSCVSRFSSGAIHYFPEFHASKNPTILEKFRYDFRRYLIRNIGFEAVMRLRCTKGLSIHTFHGNFFVRSTDLLSLPNVNPDHSFSMQIAIEDSLTECNMVGFQAALLYTTTKGERRIRVHTMSLPVTSKLSDVFAYADQEAVASSLTKLAVDRTLMSSLGDAREALMNACIDCLKVYRTDVSNQRHSQAILAPYQLRLLPLYILSLMKNEAFKLGSGVALDTRVFSLLEYKWMPLLESMLKIYPRLYSILDLIEEHDVSYTGPPVLQASAEKLSRQGIYLMDTGKVLYLFVGRNTSEQIIQRLFNMECFEALPEKLNRIPELDNPINIETRKFIEKLRCQRSFYSVLEIIREDTKYRMLFLNNLLDDRTESSMSYQEFLQHIQRQLNG